MKPVFCIMNQNQKPMYIRPANTKPADIKPKPMRLISLCCLLCGFLLLCGCASSANTDTKENAAENAGCTAVGNTLEIRNASKRLTLLDNKDALAADGLYYAAWTIGESEPYENSDGDTVDLYDAQLYLLLGEAKNAENAQQDMGKWLAAARTNYEILNEEEISCSGQTYTLITYNCIGKDTPYARGVSAFCTSGSSALCAELTCRADFEDDLNAILTDFLNHCYWLETAA